MEQQLTTYGVLTFYYIKLPSTRVGCVEIMVVHTPRYNRVSTCEQTIDL